jgi:translation elongation factor EF-G
MGLDARVYLAKDSLPCDVEAIGAKKDHTTGEYYFEGICAESQFPPDFFVAVHKRLGNVDTIAELRNELEEVLGTSTSLLYQKCLYGGTHGGDVIENKLLDQIESEVVEALRKSAMGRPLLREFLDAMAELVRVAKREKNPIVFV